MLCLDSLDVLLFPIEERPLFVHGDGPPMRVPNRKALLNTHTSRVIGVVGNGYQLVTNRQALQWGLDCCRTMFPETHESEWEVSRADAPLTGGHCFLDLTHNSGRLDFDGLVSSEKPEAFGPFVRVTNSYNGLRALSFDVGFYRKICMNGLIGRDTMVRFKFSHSRRQIGPAIAFDAPAERLRQAKDNFLDYMKRLKAIELQPGDFPGFAFEALLVGAPPTKATKEDRDDWARLLTHAQTLSGQYTAALGCNGYALLNVITDLASRPPSSRFVRRDRHSLQKLAGRWLSAADTTGFPVVQMPKAA